MHRHFLLKRTLLQKDQDHFINEKPPSSPFPRHIATDQLIATKMSPDETQTAHQKRSGEGGERAPRWGGGAVGGGLRRRRVSCAPAFVPAGRSVGAARRTADRVTCGRDARARDFRGPRPVRLGRWCRRSRRWPSLPSASCRRCRRQRRDAPPDNSRARYPKPHPRPPNNTTGPARTTRNPCTSTAASNTNCPNAPSRRRASKSNRSS